jgi:hypothetical protein
MRCWRFREAGETVGKQHPADPLLGCSSERGANRTPQAVIHARHYYSHAVVERLELSVVDARPMTLKTPQSGRQTGGPRA